MNGTRFAKHYRSATDWLLDAMAAPSGGRWIKADAAARDAVRAAMPGIELELANQLVRTVRDTAIEFGYTL